MTKPYKAVFKPSLEGEGEFVQLYETSELAECAINAIANYTLMLHECSYMEDFSNIGMVYENVEGKWIEIDEDGNEI